MSYRSSTKEILEALLSHADDERSRIRAGTCFLSCESIDAGTIARMRGLLDRLQDADLSVGDSGALMELEEELKTMADRYGTVN